MYQGTLGVFPAWFKAEGYSKLLKLGSIERPAKASTMAQMGSACAIARQPDCASPCVEGN